MTSFNPDIYWTIASFLGIALTAIVGYRQWYNKKHNIQEVKKTPSKLSQKFRDSYIYLVFVERVKLRPNSAIPYMIAFPSIFWVLMLINLNYVNPILTLDQMQTDEGIVKHIHISKRGNGDSLVLVRENGEVVRYATNANSSEKTMLEGKAVKIWFQHKWKILWFHDYIYEIEVGSKRMKEYIKNSYIRKILRKKEAPSDIIFWLSTAFIFLSWTWFLNYKEKPIHKLNREKKEQQ